MEMINLCFCRAALLILMMCANSALAADTLFQKSIDAKSQEVTRTAAIDKSTTEVWGYQINGNALRADTKELILTIKPGLTVTAIADKVESTSGGGLLWQGRIHRHGGNLGKYRMKIDDLPGANYATLARRGLQINGTVTVDGQLYRVHPLGNGKHLVIEDDDSQRFEDYSRLDNLPGATLPSQHAKLDIVFPPIYLYRLPVIRVLVAYTAAGAAAAGNINNLIDVAVAQTNQSFSNSQIGASVELAGTVKVNYKESNSVFTDLARLTGTNDNYMDEIHSLRSSNSRLADVVVLITNTKGEDGGIAKIGAEADTAFAIVGANVATAKFAFGHELGHLLGARHDVGTDPYTTPFAYGHGYIASDYSFRTIMAYECTYVTCPVVNYWSNPNVSFGGERMGNTQTANNARVINERASYVASFRGGNTNPGLTEGEYNNGSGYSNPVFHLDSIMYGAIGSNQDTDYFGVFVPPGATLGAVLIPGNSSDFDLYVYGPDGTTLLTSSTKGTGQLDETTVKNNGTQAEVRFVQIRYYSGATGSTNGRYTLRLSRY